MIRKVANNTIVYLKDLLNEKKEIVERYKRKLIESKENTGKGNYRDCIEDGFQTYLDEISHTIDKMRKAY